MTRLLPLVLAVLALVASPLLALADEQAKLEVGKPAPGFTLKDQTGKDVSLSDYKGQWVVLYFYPKAGTKGCTTEACELSEGIQNFKNLNAQIIGDSPDPIDAQKKFSDEYNLQFPLLADTERRVLKEYLALGDDGKKVVRSTVIIDPAGNLAFHWPSVKPQGHADMVKAKLEELQKAVDSSTDKPADKPAEKN